MLTKLLQNYCKITNLKYIFSVQQLTRLIIENWVSEVTTNWTTKKSLRNIKFLKNQETKVVIINLKQHNRTTRAFDKNTSMIEKLPSFKKKRKEKKIIFALYKQLFTKFIIIYYAEYYYNISLEYITFSKAYLENITLGETLL